MRSAWAHRTRLLLTGFAIVLGVSFVTGTFVLTDTVNHALSSAFSNAAAGDLTVRARTLYPRTVVGDIGPRAKPPSVPESLLSTLTALPGVADAGVTVTGDVTLIGPDGKALPATSPTVGANYEPDSRLTAMRLRSGHAPRYRGEVVIDAHTLTAKHWQLGQTITVLSAKAPQAMTLVGTVGFGHASSLAGSTYVAFDASTAQTLLGGPGQWDALTVAAAPHTSLAALQHTIRDILPPGLEVVPSRVVAHENASSVKKAIGQLTTFLLGFALVAMFVGTFIIANTFAILISQRTRELALLRVLGASRRQVTASVVGEACLVGVIASAVGIAAGVGVATGLQAIIHAVGFGLPSGSPQLLGRTVVAGLAVGLLATVVSALIPARRAARVAPIQALSDATASPRSRRTRAILGAAVLAAGTATIGYGLATRPAHAPVVVGAGAGVAFLAVTMLVPLLADRAARTLGAPLARFGGTPGQLARANAARNPRRTAATASALMIGVAVVAVVSTLGTSQKQALSSVIDHTVHADYVITGRQRGFTPTAARALTATPGVTNVAEMRQGVWHDRNTNRTLAAISPATAPTALTITMASGALDSLSSGDVLIDTQQAHAHHLAVGDTLTVGFDHSGAQRLRVGGTYAPNSLLGSYLISLDTYDANYAVIADSAAFLTTTGPPLTARQRIADTLTRYPDLTLQDQAAYGAKQAAQVAQALNLVYALLALSILIAIIGIINTLALSVMERTREIGLLRAVGTQRRQIRAMIRGETVIVSLLGALLGVGTGTALGIAVTDSVTFAGKHHVAVPGGTLLTVIAASVIAGLVAAVWPARRAAGLDPLHAITVE